MSTQGRSQAPIPELLRSEVTPVTQRSVHLHIGRLVLRGVAPADREAVVQALQAQIERELAEPGVAARLAAAPSRAWLRPAPREAAAGGAADATGLGSSAARQLVRELG
jgi:hypothetical protein